jgi:2-succinyl-6-hydroxy-2,4-cyclohexadiene-1-carboxylate synthase
MQHPAVLHRIVEGPQSGGPVVLVHGFTQTVRSWDGVAERLLRHGRRVVRVDLPGHGGSAGVRLGFAEAAAAVGQAGGPGAYVGYSLGGRLCLRLALDRPEVVAALVLIGASPGLGEPSEREARRRADEALAREVEAEGTEAFLDRWLDQPLFAGLRPAPAELAARRANPPEGLASALRLLGTGVQEPLWDRLDGLAVPTLLVAGAEDPKFASLAARMAEAVGPSARVAIVPAAGHATHLQRAGAVAGLIDDFLREQGR